MARSRAPSAHRSLPALMCAGLALVALAAGAQTPADAARGSLLLDQRSEEFALRLRQSQQAHELDRATRGDPNVRREVEMLHLQQRHRQDSLHSRQLQEYDASGSRAAQSKGSGGPVPLPPDIARFQRERAAQALRNDYELLELERGSTAKPKEEVPHWGPTLTEPKPR